MDIVLVPGLWLDGSSWSRVTPAIEAAGHRAHPLTLPGLESRDADRRNITLGDHVDAVVAAIDACTSSKVLLAGHSGGCGLVHAAVDARPDRVVRAVLVGGFPIPDGRQFMTGFESSNGEVPLPEWSEFDDADLADLDEEALAAFRERAIPAPAGVLEAVQRLVDERRYEVPVTAVCTEYTAAMLREWTAGGAESLAELPRFKEVEYVDLPTGHWPQFSRPDDLAAVILGSLPLTGKQFVETDGTADWRLLGIGAGAHFRTGSFRQAAELAAAIAPLGDVGNGRLDVDLRSGGVAVTIGHYFTFLTGRDVETARQISGTARQLGAEADPSRVQEVQFMFDALVPADVMPFWRAVLGYEPRGDEDLSDPLRRWPNVQFQQMDAPRPQRNRIHVDVFVPHDEAEARVEAALAAGGVLVSDKQAPYGWTLADAEGNEVDVAQCLGREEHWGFAPDG